MTDDAAREEAYLNKMMNRNRGSNVKKNVFGGGLEAARAKETRGTHAGPTLGVQFGGLEAARAQAGITTHNSYPPIQSEVVELSLPIPAQPKPQHQSYQPPQPKPQQHQQSYSPPSQQHQQSYVPPPQQHQQSYVPPPLESEVVDLSFPPQPSRTNDKGLVDDESAAQREAERMAKSIGKFHLGPKPTPVPAAPKPTPTVSASVHGIPRSTGTSRQRKDWELPPTLGQYNTKFENFLLAEIVLARNSPETILDRLRDRRQHYRGNDFSHPEFGTIMTTVEGIAGLDDAIRELSYLSPLPNKIKAADGLSLSARDFCDIARNTTSPDETPEQAENRLTRYGQYHGELTQNVAFSNVPPGDLILDWIIDDGQGPEGRPHRRAIFNPNFNFVGIASGPHSIGRVICVLFTQEYTPLDSDSSEVSLPLPGHSTDLHSHTNLGYGLNPGHVYPSFKIGGLLDIGLANVLAINSLGCDINELYLGIRQNGKALEFHRAVNENGHLRKEIQTLTLPYAINSKRVTALYNPNNNGGELSITLMKKLANAGGAQTLEFEIANFTVIGYPGSTVPRVQIGADQKPDHYIFSPGPASPHTTDFVVVLNGNALEFKSTFSYQDGDSIKTVNGKQTVQLPTPPTIDQIDVDGSTITIWPNRTKGTGQDEFVADCDVPIRYNN